MRRDTGQEQREEGAGREPREEGGLVPRPSARRGSGRCRPRRRGRRRARPYSAVAGRATQAGRQGQSRARLQATLSAGRTLTGLGSIRDRVQVNADPATAFDPRTDLGLTLGPHAERMCCMSTICGVSVESCPGKPIRGLLFGQVKAQRRVEASTQGPWRRSACRLRACRPLASKGRAVAAHVVWQQRRSSRETPAAV